MCVSVCVSVCVRAIIQNFICVQAVLMVFNWWKHASTKSTRLLRLLFRKGFNYH